MVSPILKRLKYEIGAVGYGHRRPPPEEPAKRRNSYQGDIISRKVSSIVLILHGTIHAGDSLFYSPIYLKL